MGVNDANFPTNVRSDEEAIQYLGLMVQALKTNAYLSQTGAGPFTLTAAQMVGGVNEFNGSTTAVVVNTPTAAQIITQMQALDANAGVGSTAYSSVINDNTSSGAITVTAAANVSFAAGSTGVVAIGTVRKYLIKILTLTTVSLTTVG